MTAVQYELPLVIVIVDNGMYGTIRMHQEREYPGRVIATALKNPDFVGYARGVRRLRHEAWSGPRISPKAFAQAQASGKPAIIHLKVDPSGITPTTTLEAIRAKSLQGEVTKLVRV